MAARRGRSRSLAAAGATSAPGGGYTLRASVSRRRSHTPANQPMDIDDYLLPIDGLDWSRLFASWTWLIPPGTGVQPWLMNRFGDLFWFDADDRVNWLNVTDGTNDVVADGEEDFLEQLDDEEALDDWLMVGLVDELRAAGIVAEAGRCHGFKVLPILGGEYDAENVSTVPIEAYWGTCGDVHRQIDELPDGASIEIEIPDPPDAD